MNTKDLKNIVRPNILALQPYSSARDEFTGTNGIFLDANENPYGVLNRYPDPYQQELKQKLSQMKGVPPETIFIGNGSDEVIDIAFRVFCNPGVDKALTFTPTYGMYEVSAAINDVALIELPLTPDFQIDRIATTPYLSDEYLKIIFICSPNNPTGNLINSSAIEFILKQFKGIVIVDEAYIDFSEGESCIRLLEQYPNLMVSQTFSKAWGLAAARVGTAYANPIIIELFNKVKPPYNVSELNQRAAINALSDSSTFKQNLNNIRTEKEKLKKRLLALEMVKNIYPSDTNFLLVEVNDADVVYQQLVAQQVITRNRNKLIKNCIRITIGTTEENELLITSLRRMKLPCA